MLIHEGPPSYPPDLLTDKIYIYMAKFNNENVKVLKDVEIGAEMLLLDRSLTVPSQAWECVRTKDYKHGEEVRQSGWQGYILKGVDGDGEPLMVPVGADLIRLLEKQTKKKFFEVEGKGKDAKFTLINNKFGVKEGKLVA